ncbi:hypothetical protein DFH08DRAFT_863526, partial [Mycena albidolilacea]
MFDSEYNLWLSILGVFLSEVILVLRTWAFWDRRRTLLIWLIILTTCTLVASIVTTQLELKSLHYIPTTGVGCTLAKAGSIIIFAYLSIIILKTTIVVLTAVKVSRVLRYSRQPWLVQLYRDGDSTNISTVATHLWLQAWFSTSTFS